jgi:hypothetical protein
MVKSQGEFAFCRAIDPPEVTCVAWFDSDLVWFLSTALEPTTAIVKRHKKGHAGKVDVNVVDHCVQYNRYMGGCDVADMKRTLGMSRSKTYKWYLALFFYVIDVAVINAGVVWYSLKGQTTPGRMREWRMELLMALVAEGQGVDQDQFAAMSVPKMAP